MKNYSFLIICVIILLFSFNLSAQSFHFGPKIEMYGYLNERVRDEETYSNKFAFSELPSFYIVLKQDLTESFSINLKPGILFINSEESFYGFELGLFVNNNLPFYGAFLTGGFNLHLNTGSAHGAGWVDVSDNKIISFLFFGVGYNINDIVSVDLSFHQALNSEYGYDSLDPDVFKVSGPKKMHSMIKVGIQALL